MAPSIFIFCFSLYEKCKRYKRCWTWQKMKTSSYPWWRKNWIMKKGGCDKMIVETSKGYLVVMYMCQRKTKPTQTAIYPRSQKGNDFRDPFNRQEVIRSLHCFYYFSHLESRDGPRYDDERCLSHPPVLAPNGWNNEKGREMTLLFACKCGDAGWELEESCSCPRAHLFVGW